MANQVGLGLELQVCYMLLLIGLRNDYTCYIILTDANILIFALRLRCDPTGGSCRSL